MEYDLLIRYESQVCPPSPQAVRSFDVCTLSVCPVFCSCPSRVFHGVLTSVCAHNLDATRLGGGADNRDPTGAHPHQQPLWKYHPRR